MLLTSSYIMSFYNNLCGIKKKVLAKRITFANYD